MSIFFKMNTVPKPAQMDIATDKEGTEKLNPNDMHDLVY